MADSHSEKAPDAYRTISEVADDLNLPQHVLRFWETRFSQIKPLKRGGGRRYYRPDDVALIMGIRSLLYDQGFTIKGVQKILRESGVRHVQAAGRGESPGQDEPVRAIPPAPVLHETVHETVHKPQHETLHENFHEAVQEPVEMGAVQPASAPSPAASGPLSATARMALRNALAELAECQRILDMARRAA